MSGAVLWPVDRTTGAGELPLKMVILGNPAVLGITQLTTVVRWADRLSRTVRGFNGPIPWRKVNVTYKPSFENQCHIIECNQTFYFLNPRFFLLPPLLLSFQPVFMKEQHASKVVLSTRGAIINRVGKVCVVRGWLLRGEGLQCHRCPWVLA